MVLDNEYAPNGPHIFKSPGTHSIFNNEDTIAGPKKEPLIPGVVTIL
jgi:hypothetical protein